MSTFLIIMSVILWVGFKAYHKAKVVFADSAEADECDQRPVRPAVDSLFEERRSSQQSVKSPYFTYETMDVTEPIFQTAETSAQQEPLQQSATAAFDLRQAVIYQTILNNDYIPEIQHQIR